MDLRNDLWGWLIQNFEFIWGVFPIIWATYAAAMRDLPWAYGLEFRPSTNVLTGLGYGHKRSLIDMESERRLIIREMVLENFKSYAGAQQVGPFHKVSVQPSTRVLTPFTDSTA